MTLKQRLNECFATERNSNTRYLQFLVYIVVRESQSHLGENKVHYKGKIKRKNYGQFLE